jgi:hypothetical protein
MTRTSVIALALLMIFLNLPAARAANHPATRADANVQQRIDALIERLPAFGHAIDTLTRDGQDVSYPTVTYTVLKLFTDHAVKDRDVAVPNHWGWVAVNGCESGFEPVRDPHSGQWAIRITNKTPAAPNVYGKGEQDIPTRTAAGKQYTISAWVKNPGPGTASIALNNSWSERLALPVTGGQWKRVSKTYSPAKSDVGMSPILLSTEPAGGIIIDDISIVEGDQPEVGKNLVANGSFEQSWTADRTARELPDMESMADRLEKQLAGAKAGKIKLPAVPRWTGQQRPVIEGPAFVGPVSAWNQQTPPTTRPIEFLGYGHFDQTRRDIPLFPKLGTNIIQCGEWGPSAIYPKEGVTDDVMIHQTLEELDTAARAGVAVDLLISPHYFPDWFFKKYPDARKARADFFPYSIYHPAARALLKQFIAHALPPLKDKPALFSICLSNEPINAQEPDQYSNASWHAWLKTHHGDVATMNRRWKTSFKSFDEVPQPNPLGKSPEPRPGGQWMDFVRWNQEAFTEFHKMLADAVHDAAPGIPVHIKSTTWHLYRSEDVQSGDDATLFGGMTQIDGNDSVNLYGFNQRAGNLIERGTVDFAQGWRENAIGYDLQQSAHMAPVFNSENHPIFDGETRYVPPAHIRGVYWQGAIHGQSATTTWVWEREKSNPRGPFAGNIGERPSCVEALGLTCLDLNRVSPQITAIQKAPPQVYMLQSFTSAVWDAHPYDDAFLKLYTALSFTGLKIGFITERQLEQGKIADAPLLLVPNCVHLSDAAFEGLKKFKGKIIVTDPAAFSKSEYDAPRKSSPHETIEVGKKWQDTWNALPPVLESAGIHPAVSVTDQAGKPISGISWVTASTPKGVVVNLYNALHDPLTFKLDAGGTYVDLLTGDRISAGQAITLQPMEVRLLRSAELK